MKKFFQYVIFLSIFLALVSTPFLVFQFFIKVKIACNSQKEGCPTDINTKLAPLSGKNLFAAKKEANKILKNEFIVTNSSMQLKLPNVLQINLIVKTPAFSILDKNSGKYYLLDSDGLILSVSDKTNTPYVIKESPVGEIGKHVSSLDLFGLKLLQGVNLMYQIQTGAIQNDTLVVDLPTGIRVIFPLRDAEVDVLLGSLRVIYTKLTTSYNGSYSQIDLRYKNPILR